MSKEDVIKSKIIKMEMTIEAKYLSILELHGSLSYPLKIYPYETIEEWEMEITGEKEDELKNKQSNELKNKQSNSSCSDLTYLSTHYYHMYDSLRGLYCDGDDRRIEELRKGKLIAKQLTDILPGRTKIDVEFSVTSDNLNKLKLILPKDHPLLALIES